MSRVLFTSDLHIGHAKVAGIRLFDSVEEHDAAIAERWREVVRKDDTVWVLGDIAMSSPAKALALLATLPGRKHLVWGNHDQGHPMNRSAPNAQRRYLDVFASVQMAARVKVHGIPVLLSHFPYVGEGDDHTDTPRHTQWRLPDEGQILLHGHTHMVDQRRHGKQLHVGLDAWGLAPVDDATVFEWIRWM
jgi:calcineurin-like phosphoesterase family protein